MSEWVAHRPLAIARLRDLVDLGKPRLSFLVIFTAAIGLWLAPTGIGLAHSTAFVVATSCLVAAANTLNCWIERELDARMLRTRERPLPAGRLEPRVALISGTVLSVLSLSVLAATTNFVTTALGALALMIYVTIYTPLKRITPWSVWVGAVPGAIPPLMGWTAATGTISTPGLYAFAILFFWQLPHFVAISLYLKEDFQRAGFKVLPLVHGDEVARRHLLAYTLMMVAVSLAALPLGVAGPIYMGVAAVLGAAFIAVAFRGVRAPVQERWARQVFAYTLIYLPLLVTSLVLDTL